jgi:hypothetical protein
MVITIRPLLAAVLLAGVPSAIEGAAPPATEEASDDPMGEAMDSPMGNQMGNQMGGDAAIGDRPLTQQEISFFENRIRPVLVAQCYGCHSAKATRVRGNLLLDTNEGMLKGGDIGPAVIPGDLDESLLIEAIRYGNPDLEMPPKAKLPPEVIQDFERWVSMGAPDPRVVHAGTIDAAGPEITNYAMDIEKGRRFWAYTPPVKPATPTVASAALGPWPLVELDRFTLASMEAKGATPADDADRRTWLRRVTFDLTGLPPTPQETESFERDNAPGAHERAVDRLLASNAFGERWGRHWLDVARYAESSGKESNVIYPHAWRYRDYVIDAFNADKPFDQFVREQIAGDLLRAENANDRAENLIATAYLAIGPKSHSAQNPRQFAFDVADEQIDAVSQGFLGVTVACARCHDHKFDPIPQKDYYAIAGIFLSTTTAFGTERSPGNRHAAPIVELPRDAAVSDGPTMPAARRSLVASAAERLKREAEEEAEKIKESKERGDNQSLFRIRQQRDQALVLETILERFADDGSPTAMNRVTMGVLESDRIVDAPVLTRGEVDKAGERVPRGFVQVLTDGTAPKIASGSGRLELAEWIASPTNPLTGRVWANRVWLHLFGRGIVPTPDNFGNSGVPPTDQRLLDHLATRLVELRWSTKALIREIVLSHTYRLASTESAASSKADPENTTFWRYPSRRLDAEVIRDSMLFAAGILDRTRPDGSQVNFAEGAIRGPTQQLLAGIDAPSNVRSVYLPIVRDQIPESLEVFDFAEPAFVTGDRAETNVPTQALFLMNSPEVLRASDAFAARLLASDGSDSERIMLAFRLTLGRKPSASEISASRDFLKDFVKANANGAPTGERSGSEGNGRRGRLRERAREQNLQRNSGRSEIAPTGEKAAWSAFCQALYQSAEFRSID